MHEREHYVRNSRLDELFGLFTYELVHRREVGAYRIAYKKVPCHVVSRLSSVVIDRKNPSGNNFVILCIYILRARIRFQKFDHNRPSIFRSL